MLVAIEEAWNNDPLEIKSNPAYNRVVDYFNGRFKTQPDAADARTGLMQLAAHTNIRYNSVCRDVIDALIRQPFTRTTIPFANAKGGADGWTINAADFDLGRNGNAYYDKDTGNYRVSTGRNSAGNRGRAYRNDGVDIYRDSSDALYVGNIEDGEWLQYTITLNEKAAYDLKIVGAAAADTSRITVQVNDKPVFANTSINPTGKPTDWQTQSLGKLELDKGTHVIRLQANKGGFNLKQLLLTKP